MQSQKSHNAMCIVAGMIGEKNGMNLKHLVGPHVMFLLLLFFFSSSFFNNMKVQYCVQKLFILVLSFSTFSIKCPKLLILM